MGFGPQAKPHFSKGINLVGVCITKPVGGDFFLPVFSGRWLGARGAAPSRTNIWAPLRRGRDRFLAF